VENVLVRKGKTWHKLVSCNSHYIARQMPRRPIPPRKILHLCVKAVYDYFMDKKTDSKTRKQVFEEIAKDMASNVIKALYRGEVSDPPGISWYMSSFDNRWKSQD
jgi:hypothetical protein